MYCFNENKYKFKRWKSFPKGFKQDVAAKMKQGISSTKILDDVRDNVGVSFKREHMLDEQDLRNIALSYGIDEVKQHENDQNSVLSWIEEWEGKERNLVLYYKLQGRIDENESRLKSGDFIIILQTDQQVHLMQEFGHKGNEVYKYLRTVLEQTDKTLFETYLANMMTRLHQSSVTKPFADYFEKE